ncbi:hypothetical protein AAH991_24970 [Microbispora sp. ZYX-F-249]|uniref:Secreted protein n=1 Tax=Microbispora maris TaxID=3144104 RepID=A0ABV0ASY0_9ACTN
MSRISVRLGLATAVSAVAVLGVSAAAAPAHAVDEKWHTLVLHDDAGYEGAIRTLYTVVSNDAYDRVYMPSSSPDLGGFGDKTSSLTNNDWMAWIVYDDKQYRDRHYCVRPGETVPNLSSSQWKFNDKISSARRLDTASCAGYPAFYSVG